MFTGGGALRRFSPNLALLMVLPAGALLGCGGPKYVPPAVGGTITWQDGSEPRELEGSTVEFEANGTVVAKTVLTADGTFRLDDPLPLGTYRVRVLPPTKPSVLDPRFESFETSTFTLTATAEPQRAAYKVKKRGG